MRCAAGVLVIAVAAGCSTPVDCGEDREAARAAGASFCVYSERDVVDLVARRGGFRCPGATPHQLTCGSTRVCASREYEGCGELPAEVCDSDEELGIACRPVPPGADAGPIDTGSTGSDASSIDAGALTCDREYRPQASCPSEGGLLSASRDCLLLARMDDVSAEGLLNECCETDLRLVPSDTVHAAPDWQCGGALMFEFREDPALGPGFGSAVVEVTEGDPSDGTDLQAFAVEGGGSVSVDAWVYVHDLEYDNGCLCSPDPVLMSVQVCEDCEGRVGCDFVQYSVRLVDGHLTATMGNTCGPSCCTHERDAWRRASSPSPLPPETWHRVRAVFVFDDADAGADTVTLQVDDGLVITGHGGCGSGTRPRPVDGRNVCVTLGGTDVWPGYIDEILIERASMEGAP